MPFVKKLLQDFDPDVVCFNEYGVDPETPVHWEFPGYARVAADLRVPKAGVAIFIKTGFKEQYRLVDIRHDLRWAQIAAIDINDLRVIAVYRSPNMPSDELAPLQEIFNRAMNTTNKCVLVSDMNIHADWQEYVATGTNDRRIHQELLDFFLEKNLVQMNFQPTRNDACIDIALTNAPNEVVSCTTINDHEIDKIDHKPVFTVVNLRVWHHDLEIVRPKKKYDEKTFMEEIRKIDQNVLLNMSGETPENVNNLNEEITKGVLAAMDASIPEMEIDHNKPKRPLQFQLSEKSSELLDQQRLMRKKKDFKAAKILRKKLKASIKNDQRNWTNAKARKLDSNTDEVWRLINQANDRGSLMGGLRLKEEDQELEFRPQQKAEILMTRYASVMTPKTIPTCDPSDLEGSESVIGLTDFELDEEIVKDAVKKANNSWADDHQGLNMYMLKKAALKMLPVFHLLIYLTLTTCTLAEPWLTALIAPVPKKGDPTLAKNFRPVTIEHAILRLVEIVVNTLLVGYLNSRNFFHRCQFGFRQGHSCVHNLVDFWSFTSDIMKRKGMCDVVYADTSAAFDRLSHGILLDKLYHEAGVAGRALMWIKAWLSNRKQFVKMGKHKSRTENVTSSCLQGSCLGTTLWNVYINQLCYQIEEMIKDLGIPDGECQFWLYADDIKISFYPTRTNAAKVNRILRMVCKEMTNLHLAFNPTKCSVLTMGLNNPRYRLYMQDEHGKSTLLKRVKVERDLGLMVDADGSFNTMYRKGIQTARTTARFLSKIFEKSVWRVKLQTYHSHVFSRLAYASELSRKTTAEANKEYDSIYEHFFKFVQPPKNAWAPFTPTQLLHRKDLFLLHDIYKGRSPVDPTKVFPPVTKSNVVTRSQSSQSATKLLECKWTKNLILQRNIDSWNSIPLAMRDAPRHKFRAFVDEEVLPRMESNSMRWDLMSGEMRKRWLRRLDHLKKVENTQNISLMAGLERNFTPDPVFDDENYDDDFTTSDHCEKQHSRKSKRTVELLSIYAPYSLLCHCVRNECRAEVVKFELKHGSLRQFHKAYVRDGLVRDKIGPLRKPFYKRMSGVENSVHSGSYQTDRTNPISTKSSSSKPTHILGVVPFHHQRITHQAEPGATAPQVNEGGWSAGLPKGWDASFKDLFYS